MDFLRQDERNRAYSKVAAKYKELFINELQNKPLDRKLYDLFHEKVINTGKIIEIGCGPGEISNYLWMKGVDITGIDYSAEMVTVAKEYNGNIEFKVGNVFDLDYENGSVAGIVAPYLIVNFTLDEVKAAFAEMNRVLKINGNMLISFHIGKDENVVFNDFLTENNKITYTFFKVETIKQLLKDAGFKITELVIKEPYEGEVTTRAYIFLVKENRVDWERLMSDLKRNNLSP